VIPVKRRIESWSLRAKLWLSLGGLFFILLVGSAVSAVVLTHFSQELQRLLRENYDSEVFCDQMIDALDRLDAFARQQTWNEAPEPIDAAVYTRQFEDNLNSQLHNVSLPGELEKSRYLAVQWHSYQQDYRLLSSLDGPGRQRLYLSSLLPIYHGARSNARQIAVLNMNNLVSADGRIRTRMIEARNILLILVGAGAALAIVVLGAIGTTVLEPLRDLIRSARQIGAGDLNMTVSVRTQDEVGQLAEAFNTMAADLRAYRQIDHDRLSRAQGTTQMAIDSLPDAVIVLSLDGIIEISNRTAFTHFGADPGKRVEELGLEWLATIFERVVRGLGPADPRGYSTAIQLFDDGHERFLLPRGVPMINPAGCAVGVTIILADVTNLRRADEFKSGLVSTVSHELRTPLTSIRMSAMLLADEILGPLTPQQRKLVHAARDEAERLYRIIESLLEFSRAQASAAKPLLRPASVKTIVAGAMAPLATGFAEKGIDVTVDVHEAPEILADANCAISAISNLLSNALKFTPAGGRVSIAAQASGEHVSITVADTGPGVPPEYAERIFERFFRIPGREAVPGSGLGLAIARELIQANGGSLVCRSAPGGGTSFELKLPAAEIAAAAPCAIATETVGAS